MNGFPIGFFRPKIAARDHAAFVGARRARTRGEITHSSRSLLKFPSVSGNSHHCLMEIKVHIIVKLKRDFTDLLKQIHIYQGNMRIIAILETRRGTLCPKVETF